MGERGDIVLPGWQSMSYFSDVSNLCWFLEPEFAHQVRRLHSLVGNAVVDDGRFIIVGTGSTQLFQAALYALSPPDAAEPMNVVSAIPYYSVSPITCTVHKLSHRLLRFTRIIALSLVGGATTE